MYLFILCNLYFQFSYSVLSHDQPLVMFFFLWSAPAEGGFKNGPDAWEDCDLSFGEVNENCF